MHTRTSGSFKKGQGGKKKGAVNKTTQKARELFTSIMEDETEHIKKSFELVRRKDPAKYLEVLSKFYPYFIPKKIDLQTNDQPLTLRIIRD